jgi:hypothetical protein
MNDTLFFIVALLLLSLITGVRMLVHIWGKKYRYKNAWELLNSDEDRLTVSKRNSKKYGK